ncbi:MAG: site-specific integrase [Nitrospira sp.]|nr:site-specific integrase [Nitrospira sp.]
MAVRQLPDGKWKIDVRDVNNIRRKPIFETEEEAKLAEAKILSLLPAKGDRNRHTPQRKITFESFVKELIANAEEQLAEKKAKLGTIKVWQTHLNRIPESFKHKPLTRISTDQCRKFLHTLTKEVKHVPGGKGQAARPRKDGKRLKEDTARQRFGFVKATLKKAVQAGHIAMNPARDLVFPKTPHREADDEMEIDYDDVLTFVELRKFMSVAACKFALKPMLYVLICVLALTGMRCGEVRALQRLHIELDYFDRRTGKRRPRIAVRQNENQGALGLPKNWHKRYVDVPPTLEKILRWWLTQIPAHPHTWLFRALQLPKEGSAKRARAGDLTHGWCVDHQTVDKAVQKTLAELALGRHLTTHVLRHSYASCLLDDGEDLLVVSRNLGHKDSGMTEKVYAKWCHPKSNGALVRLDNDLAVHERPVSDVGEQESVMGSLDLPQPTVPESLVLSADMEVPSDSPNAA